MKNNRSVLSRLSRFSAGDVEDSRDVSFNLGVRGEKESGFRAMAAAGDGVTLEQTTERMDCETKR